MATDYCPLCFYMYSETSASYVWRVRLLYMLDLLNKISTLSRCRNRCSLKTEILFFNVYDVTKKMLF